MTSKFSPALESGGSLGRYLAEIRQFPLLEAQEEYMLAQSLRKRGNIEAAHRLIASHLRLVVKIAMGYRGYGLPICEIVSEGNIGLMQAVRKFDPDRGFRLATYAIWWIRASIQEYILRSWSIVKMGTTTSQRKLFFNLRKMKRQISALDEGDLYPDQVSRIASSLGVSGDDVISMNRRLSGDRSLNVTQRTDGEEGQEWQDTLVDESMDQEQRLAEKEEWDRRRSIFSQAFAALSARERRILETRRLTEAPLTLAELSDEYQVSRERIRQLEAQAMDKVRKNVLRLSAQAQDEVSSG